LFAKSEEVKSRLTRDLVKIFRERHPKVHSFGAAYSSPSPSASAFGSLGEDVAEFGIVALLVNVMDPYMSRMVF
jgi:hypothetical protein